MLRASILLFTALTATVSVAAQWLVVTEDAPPLQYVVKGEVRGISTKIVKEVLQLAKVQSRFEVFPWARAFDKALKKPNTLIYSTIRTPEREAQFHWIGKIGRFQLAIMGLEDNRKFNISHIEQAKGFVIGVMRDDFTHEYLNGYGFHDEDLVIRSSLLELMDLLHKGLIDGFLIDRYLVCDLAREYQYDCDRLKVALPLPELAVDVYLAANKDSDPEDLQRLSAAFQIVKAKPEFQSGFTGQ